MITCIVRYVVNHLLQSHPQLDIKGQNMKTIKTECVINVENNFKLEINWYIMKQFVVI